MRVWLVRAGRYGERENLALQQRHNATSSGIHADLPPTRILVHVPGSGGGES